MSAVACVKGLLFLVILTFHTFGPFDICIHAVDAFHSHFSCRAQIYFFCNKDIIFVVVVIMHYLIHFLILWTVKSFLPSPSLTLASCMVITAMYIAVLNKADIDLTLVLTFFPDLAMVQGTSFVEWIAILVITMKIILRSLSSLYIIMPLRGSLYKTIFRNLLRCYKIGSHIC